MSLFAGIYSKHNAATLASSVKSDIDSMTQHISRADDPVTTFLTDRCFLAKVDVGIFDGPSFQISDNRSVVATVGKMFFRPESNRHVRRDEELAAVAASIREMPDLLRDAHGSYALVAFDSANQSFLLATDKYGSRPIYVYESADYIYFANALRVLEHVDRVPKRLDLLGVSEMCVFGYALGDRTPYADVKLLPGGSMFSASDGRSCERSYFRWDEIEPTTDDPRDFTQRAYDLFLDSVRCRSHYCETVVATLSGGLDSRCVVAALQSIGKTVASVTFETRGRVDDEFAVAYAQASGVRNIVLPFSRTQAPQKATTLLRDSWPDSDQPPHADRIFSGDGGSVGIGFVHADQEVIRLARKNDHRAAARNLLTGKSLPRKIMDAQLAGALHQAIEDHVVTEFKRLGAVDPGRHAQIFFLNNQQRRHMHTTCENVDLMRFEFILPIMDGRFMQYLLSLPTDVFPGHRFYHDWLSCFPDVVTSVPWQTYPGHLPCPVPATESKPDQWTKTVADIFASGSASYRESLAAIRRKRPFPKGVLRRNRLLMAMLIHGLRIKPYGYGFRTYLTIQEYFAKCQGVVAWPSL